MNERIQKLAEQAGLKVEFWMTNPPKPFQILGSTEDFEKFAELIVRECLTFVEPMPGSGDIDDLALEAARDSIKEHFGVD